MKTARIVTLITMSAVLLCACQPTPDDSIVARKDAEHMIELAETGQEEPGISIAEQYGVPEHYEYESSELDGRFTLKVDADVIVPGVSSMPIARVQETDFTQEQVSGVFQALCGDTEMWNVRESGERTKSEIEKSILYLQKNFSDENYLQNSSEAQLEADRAHLQYLQSIYAVAPESIASTRCNGELMQKIERDVVNGNPLYTYMGLYAMSDDNQIEMYVKNRSSNCADDGSDGAPLSATMSFLNHRERANFEQENSKRVTDMNTISEEAKDRGLTITPSQAVKTANEFFTKAGLSGDFAVDSVYYADKNAYFLSCVRRTGNAPCIYIEDVSYGEDQYAPYWEYECINMFVDESGIFRFDWRAPISVTEMVTENAALKTFGEIMEIYKDAVSYTYVAKLRDTDNKIYHIDRITLSLQRISEQNALGFGLLVPVWNFYGTEQYSIHVNDEVISGSSVIMNSMLSINAIDGTIIDIEKGY